MCDATDLAGAPGRLFKHQHVMASGHLRLDRVDLAIYGDRADDLLIKVQRTLGIAHCKGNVGETAGLDHRCSSHFAALRGRLARTRRKRGEISGFSEHFVDFRGMHLLGQDHLSREFLERN